MNDDTDFHAENQIAALLRWALITAVCTGRMAAVIYGIAF